MTILLNYCAVGQNIPTDKTPEDILDCLAKSGVDNNPELNECESNCLNYIYQHIRGDFDFHDKTVVFFTGSSGETRVTKKWYFDQKRKVVDFYGYIPLPMCDQIVIFDELDARNTGYDAVVFNASKKYYTQKKAIALLKKKKQKSMDF